MRSGLSALVEPGGSGLGLAITWALVTDHGGTITLDGTAAGTPDATATGARFVVVPPVAGGSASAGATN